MKKDDRDLKGSRDVRERLQSSALSRASVIGQLSAATEPYHRHVLGRALASLDAEAEALERGESDAGGADLAPAEPAGVD